MQPPSIGHNVSFAMDAGDRMRATRWAARSGTLRELKAVSVAYRRRARQTMGDATSAWRKHPVWSTSARGDELAAELRGSVRRVKRLRALEAMKAMEAN